MFILPFSYLPEIALPSYIPVFTPKMELYTVDSLSIYIVLELLNIMIYHIKKSRSLSPSLSQSTLGLAFLGSFNLFCFFLHLIWELYEVSNSEWSLTMTYKLYIFLCTRRMNLQKFLGFLRLSSRLELCL